MIAKMLCKLVLAFVAMAAFTGGYAQDLVLVPIGTLPAGTPVLLGNHSAGFGPDPTRVIPLSSVASQASINSIAASAAGINAALLQSQNRQLLRDVAMAASLSPTMPAPGHRQNLTVATAYVGSEQAVSINYAALLGPVSFVAGAARGVGGGAHRLGKLGLGYSW